MQVKIKKLHPLAQTPVYASAGAAAFDLHSVQAGMLYPHAGCMVIKTGLAFEIPENHVMLVFSRSSHGFKNNVRLANCVGVIDSDYRGEVMVKLMNDGIQMMDVNIGDRIAQGMILPVQQVSFEFADELSDTVRGEQGFGSTGV
jgi:dUTP pyrophosphatase